MSNAHELFDEAVSHHKAGRLADADKLYREFIKSEAAHPEALRLLGTLYLQMGRMTEASEILEKAVKLLPHDPATLTNLGSSLRGVGKLDEAIDVYKQVLKIHQDYIPALNNLGGLYHHMGRGQEALELYEKVLKLSPGNAKAYFNYGKLLEKLGRGDQSIKCYEQALKLEPHYVEAMTKLGVMLSLTGHKEQSMQWLKTAQDLLEKNYRADPKNAEVLNNLGYLLSELGTPEDALTYFRKALDLRPDYFSCILNMASCLRDLHRLEEALDFCQRAVDLNPDSADAHIMLGGIFRDMVRHEEAIEQLDKVLIFNPSSLNAQMNKSMSLLALGQYEEGFRLYEKGLVDLPYMRGKSLFTERRWEGESLIGKRLLIWGEQGLGDNLQFIRYAELCKEKGGRIIVLCPKTLRSLLSHCAFIDELPESVEEKDFDFHVPVMSLPYLFNTTLENIPASVPYLHVGRSAQEKWAQKFTDDGAFRVGLVWSGNPREREMRWYALNQRRNIDLEKLRPLFDIAGIHYYSLQMGAAATQMDQCNLRNDIIDLTPHIDDFEDTAALIENLDLVISVDTSVVHLTGGMGKPIWVLSRFDGCWRWLKNRPENPWYPTAKIFGQASSGDWESVVHSVRDHLEAYAEMMKSHKKHPIAEAL